MALLTGKVCLVTGASRGIGLATARVLASRGAKVVLSDVAAESGAAAAAALAAEVPASGATFVACDVAKRASVEAAVAHAVEKHGRLDCLVANAGIVRAAPFLDMTDEEFGSVIDVNLKGVFLSVQVAARQMVAQQPRGGAIVTMSSVNDKLTIPTIANYCAAKGGVAQLTRCAALELAQSDVRVNAVAPGSIATEVFKEGETSVPIRHPEHAAAPRQPPREWRAPPPARECPHRILFPPCPPRPAHPRRILFPVRGADAAPLFSPSFRPYLAHASAAPARPRALAPAVNGESVPHKVLARTPMGRVGEPEEIGKTVGFLLSDDASYITGETIYVDGGRGTLNYTVPGVKITDQ